MTPHERADLAEAMVPVACRLAGAVRDDPDEIQAILDDLEPQQWPALTIVLAAMIDIDRPAAELLAWTDWAQPTRGPSRYGVPAHILAAHAAHSRGHRDPHTIAGERAYQAARYRHRTEQKGAA